MTRETKYLLWSSNFWYFGSGLFGPLFAVFTQQIGGNIFDITEVWAAYLISMGGFIILFGKLSDSHYSKHRMILLGYLLNAILTFGYLLVRAPFQLFLIQVGLGFSYALAAPTWNALYGRHSQAGRDGYAWGLSSGFEKIATGFAILIGGLIVARFSFRVLFLLMGCVQLLALFLQWRSFSNRTIHNPLGDRSNGSDSANSFESPQ
jgi:predicted MFS family arabinose efflux permease